jgi:dipeptidyl aminopeptidase/acylaminoacyl peptidase
MDEVRPALTAESVVDCAVAAEPAISPDGRRVAYTVAANRGNDGLLRSALWVTDADGGSPPRQLTDDTAHDRSPRWAPDCAALFFLSDRSDPSDRSDRPGQAGRPEPGTARLWRTSPDRGRPEALTAWRGGIHDHRPLADGRTVALLAEDEPTAEQERRKAEGDDAVVWGRDVSPRGCGCWIRAPERFARWTGWGTGTSSRCRNVLTEVRWRCSAGPARTSTPAR